MKRTFRLAATVHAWLGAVLALWLLLASLSGAVLVWKEDLVRWTLGVNQPDFTPGAETLAPIAAAAEARYGEAIFGIQFAREDFPLTKVSLEGSRYAYLDGQGRLLQEWTLNERWEEWLYDLHHRLLLGDLGLSLVGGGGLLAMLLVLLGLLAFWPLRRGWRLGLRPRDASRPALLVTHRNLGLWLSLPLLLTLLTGVLLAFPLWVERNLVEPLRDEAYSDALAQGLDDVSGPGTGDWLPALQRAQASFPEAVIRSARVPSSYAPYRIIGLEQPGELNRTGQTLVYIEAKGGWMDVRIDALGLPLRERLINAALPLHTGRSGSLLHQLALSAFGLLLAGLAGLGLVCFLRRPWGRAPAGTQ